MNYIYKAKSLYDGSWVYGYYVHALWADNGNPAHLIIERNTKYKGAGEFDWHNVHRIDQDSLCICDSTELMEG